MERLAPTRQTNPPQDRVHEESLPRGIRAVACPAFDGGSSRVDIEERAVAIHEPLLAATSGPCDNQGPIRELRPPDRRHVTRLELRMHRPTQRDVGLVRGGGPQTRERQ